MIANPTKRKGVVEAPRLKNQKVFKASDEEVNVYADVLIQTGFCMLIQAIQNYEFEARLNLEQFEAPKPLYQPDCKWIYFRWVEAQVSRADLQAAYKAAFDCVYGLFIISPFSPPRGDKIWLRNLRNSGDFMNLDSKLIKKFKEDIYSELTAPM